MNSLCYHLDDQLNCNTIPSCFPRLIKGLSADYTHNLAKCPLAGLEITGFELKIMARERDPSNMSGFWHAHAMLGSWTVAVAVSREFHPRAVLVVNIFMIETPDMRC